MAAPSVDGVKLLMAKKDDIEKEIKELNTVLESQKSIGMTDSLVDAEQFPRADIDVYTVRHARQRILCLQNDHKELMAQIEEGLYTIHAEVKAQKEAEAVEQGTEAVTSAAQAMEVEQEDWNKKAFVKVDRVDQGSPAEAAGLQIGDLVVRFGSIYIDNFNTLQDIGKVVQHSVGRPVSVTVSRNQKEIHLGLVPKSWSGKGLLGCNIVPLKS